MLVHVGQIPGQKVKTDMEHDDVTQAVFWTLPQQSQALQ